MNCSVIARTNKEIAPPFSHIKMLEHDEVRGFIFMCGGSKIPEILRWARENECYNIHVKILDGEITNVLSVVNSMNPVTFQKIESKIPQEIRDLLRDRGWDVEKIYTAVRKAKEESGELKPEPLDPF